MLSNGMQSCASESIAFAPRWESTDPEGRTLYERTLYERTWTDGAETDLSGRT